MLLLLAGDYAAFRSIANHTDPVAMDTIVSRYRRATSPAATTAAGIAALAAPEPGVYQYRTTGSEHTDAVGGATHAYPALTTITVTPAAGGYVMRWDALEQRWDDWAVTIAGRQLVVTGEHTAHEFFGVRDVRAYDCADAQFRPAADTPGTRIGGRCTSAGDTGMWSGEVKGTETVAVGGVEVAAIHVVMTEAMSGDTTGTRKSENWFAVDSGLLLRRISSVDGDSATPIGRAHYTEHVELVLTSLTPLL